MGLIKTTEEIQKMRVAGKLASEVLDYITPFVKEGVHTKYLNDLCHDYMVNVQNTIPAPLNYGADWNPKGGFPASICTSLNNVICHGIPSEKDVLKHADILNIDVTVIKDGYFGDTSRMFLIENPEKLALGKKGVSPAAKKLVGVTYEAMMAAIEQVKPGVKLGIIGQTIQKIAKLNGYAIVEDFCGHGIGDVFHCEPQVVHFATKDMGMTLKAGMTFTIEPMLNLGKKHSLVLKDGWTAVTADRSLSAQWEHTILVTETGVEILTVS
jgi:methionyl aminopeptidase